ncbi:TIGR03086 family metal-binding protein [Nonomuraea jiangxiensis]|uniref:TIGR03086 family protein n=1 Tax=Nonomuraea jiangxiensis TaxID=633440 RepID=A0A1G8PUD7_9ACTN|nr:TIGR03086 family metal-binding protein [Nonomuraea jiangxiensis]SDI95968.1 TIGR03086 family protein [Nonomuraea jiangxiensis]
MSEIAERFDRLAGAFQARIEATPADRWDRVSPCEGWTARDVVAHVINGHRGIIAAVRGTPPQPSHRVGVSGMDDAPKVEPGADLVAAYAEARAGMRTLLTDPGLAATPLPFSPIGPVPVERAADVVGALELLVHTWDLARAVGGDEILDLEAVVRTHNALRHHYDGLQATDAFRPKIAAPADADPQTAFLCFTGRRP